MVLALEAALGYSGLVVRREGSVLRSSRTQFINWLGTVFTDLRKPSPRGWRRGATQGSGHTKSRQPRIAVRPSFDYIQT